jgi:hypothetical protein
MMMMMMGAGDTMGASGWANAVPRTMKLVARFGFAPVVLVLSCRFGARHFSVIAGFAGARMTR